MEDLQSLIQRYVILGNSNAKGWQSVKCQVCVDYKERGAFNFSDSEKISYNCFNCGTKGVYDRTTYKLSSTMRDILSSFGIPEDELNKAVASNFFVKKIAEKKDPTSEKKILSFPTNEIQLPQCSSLISTDQSPWCEVAREYLRSRKLDPEVMPFYVSEHKSYVGRVIIPYVFRNKLIYWQGRSMDSSISPRYKNPVVDKLNIFFNMDEVYRSTSDPLFISEGPLDALSIGRTAVATLGSSLSEFHLQELNRVSARRKVIFVIDKNSNGYKLGMSVLSLNNPNFYVTCFPDNIDDANDALQQLGKLFIAAHLSTTAVTGFAGKLLLEMKCSKR